MWIGESSIQTTAIITDSDPDFPEKILLSEFNALARCLKDAVVKTGQIYRFHAVACRLGIESHAHNPPHSLTAALGQDIEKYDQICDSIEAHLATTCHQPSRSVDVASPVPPPTSGVLNETFAQPSSDGSKTTPRNSPVLNSFPGRRPSAISISSLHRPQFPLKLDLSSTSLRITEEEATVFTKGLASPVTLAPKSARALGPSESFPELMATFGGSSSTLDAGHGPPNMDLSLPDGMHMSEKGPDLATLAAGLGDSLEKPIELDLDAMDIEMASINDHFGSPVEDPGHTGDGLFSPVLDNGESGQQLQVENDQSQKEENDLANFQMDANMHDELFGNFSSRGQMELTSDASIPHPPSTSMPFSTSLLAQFSSAADSMEGKTSSTGDSLVPDSGETFVLNSIDLANLGSGFFSDGQSPEMNFSLDMESFLNMNPDVDSQGDSNTSKAQDQAQN
ncbi:hypothetical protein CPB84DRAFT_1841340 [Gymnopilus junonius]|uniref:Uncharacterized protein n=1 Tax=Gymnopilus junonius TaxID=109634 RepID=A0A9P5TV51_GYMJU|nr:hypothetical protein CPB84DRAFT_1841340 [Gymnopilus junonius]